MSCTRVPKSTFVAVDEEIVSTRNLHNSGLADHTAYLDRILNNVKDKLKEIKDCFASVHDFLGLVAGEVQKHHAAFSLVGSHAARAECGERRIRTSVHTLEHWDQ